MSNPGTDYTLGLGQGFEPVLPGAFFLQRLDEALHDAVLLRLVGPDELLPQPIASDGFCVALAGEDQARALLTSQEGQLRGSSQMPETVDHHFFQAHFRCLNLLSRNEASAQK